MDRIFSNGTVILATKTTMASGHEPEVLYRIGPVASLKDRAPLTVH